MSWQFHTFMRFGSSTLFKGGRARYLKLRPEQPLILTPEPDNPKHQTAVRVSDLMGQPVGYLAAEDAAVVFMRIAAGEILLAKTTDYPDRRECPVLVWSEGETRAVIRRAELELHT